MSTTWDGRQGFQNLLCSLFDEESFRRFIALGVDGEIVSRRLRGPPVDLETLVHEAVTTLIKHGLLETKFFERLIVMFEKREAEIRREWSIWASQQPAELTIPEIKGVDSERRRMSSELGRAQRQRDRLSMEGRDTTEVESSIARHRRELRHGPKLKPLDYLDGRYCLLEIIGDGGFGSVWRAVDRVQQMQVAVKVLHSHYVDNPPVRSRFVQGALIMAQMQHPNIIRVLRGTFEDDGYVAYVMEYVEGGDLRRRTLRERLPFRDLVAIFVQLASSLHHAHGHRCIHRDIKPSNILLDLDGVPHLTDFDLIKSEALELTHTGSVLGTYLYMAPEVRGDAKAATVRSDLYSLGMTLLFCLIGEDPPVELSGRKAWLASLSCPQHLREICTALIDLDPLQRPESALRLREMLLSVDLSEQPRTVQEPQEWPSAVSVHAIGDDDAGSITPRKRGCALRVGASIFILVFLGVSIAWMIYSGAQVEGDKITIAASPAVEKQRTPTVALPRAGGSSPRPRATEKVKSKLPSVDSVQSYVDSTMYSMVLCANKNDFPRQVVEFLIEFDSEGKVTSSEISQAADHTDFVECAYKVLRSVRFTPEKDISVIKARYDLEPR